MMQLMCPNLKALCKHSKSSQESLEPQGSHAVRHSVTIIYIESNSGEAISVFLDVFQHNLTAGNKVSQHYVTNQLANFPSSEPGNQLYCISP